MADPTIDSNYANNTKVRFPFGEADTIDVTAAAVMAATVRNSQTLIKISEMGAAGTINLTVDPETEVGAKLTIQASAAGSARVLTFGTGMSGVAYSFGSGKSAALTFEFDGTNYVNTGAILLS